MTSILTGSPDRVLALAGCGQSQLTRFACDPASPWHVLARELARLGRQLAGWWPVLAAAVILAAAAAVAIAIVAAHARAAAARQARWVEVIPPPELPPDAAEALWRALAGMLARARPRLGRTPRLAAEFTAGQDGVRAGIWVPPGLSAAQVAGVVTRCLPGTRALVSADPPALRAGQARLSASHVSAAGGPWAPLTDPARLRPRAGSPDPLHSVLAALASRAPGETVTTQLIVSAARPARRDAGPLWARGSLALLKLPFRVLLAVADVFLRGTARRLRGPRSPTTQPSRRTARPSPPSRPGPRT